MRQSWFAACTIVIAANVAVGIGGASAASVSGSLATTDLTFNRPSTCLALSDLSTSTYFDAYAFSVSATGAFDVAVSSGKDSFLALYSGSFDRTQPLTGCVATDDDDGPGFDAAVLGSPLTAGIQYFAVVTSFGNGATFDYTLTINPNAANTTGGVATFGLLPRAEAPEPGTLGLLGLGLMGLGLGATRRRR
jgi:hypothetical protein